MRADLSFRYTLCPPAILIPMSDVTRIVSQMEQGDPQAAEKLLPLVYDELRELAAAKLVHGKPGQTLQATALVHEAYVRLVGNQRNCATNYPDRRRFFLAAAHAMRRILIERARGIAAIKRGGQRQRIDLESLELAEPERSEE